MGVGRGLALVVCSLSLLEPSDHPHVTNTGTWTKAAVDFEACDSKGRLQTLFPREGNKRDITAPPR